MKCKDCAFFNAKKIRQCIAYNNDVEPEDDATYCCEFYPVKKTCEDCKYYWQNCDTENQCNGQKSICHEYVYIH